MADLNRVAHRIVQQETEPQEPEPSDQTNACGS